MLRSLEHTARTKPDNYDVVPIDHTYSREEYPVGYSVTDKHWDLAKRYENLVAESIGMEYTELTQRMRDLEEGGIEADPMLFMQLGYIQETLDGASSVVFGDKAVDLMELEGAKPEAIGVDDDEDQE